MTLNKRPELIPQTFVVIHKHVKESTATFLLDSGDSCFVDWVLVLDSFLTLVDMENPPQSQPSSLWSFFAVLTQIFLFLADFYKHTCHILGFPALHSGISLTASLLLIQQVHFLLFFFFLTEHFFSFLSVWENRETKWEWRSAHRREFLRCSSDLYMLL